MGLIAVLTCIGSDWNRALPMTLKYTGPTKGTWAFANPNLVPWGLLAVDSKGTFTVDVPGKQIEFWCQDPNDSPGIKTLCFWIYDAPTSRWDKSAKGSDGMIYYPKNPAGTECDLNWMRWG